MDKLVQRRFILGEEWLYYKIYTGAKTADTILNEFIHPITERLIQSGYIDKWFFIRYADPKHHLRIRFHVTQPNTIGGVINALLPALQSLVQQDLIWSIQTDTYQRELERYGANSITVSESLFYQNSKMIVDAIGLLKEEGNDSKRWLFSIKSVDAILNDFNYSLQQKLELIKRLKIGFRAEFDTSKVLGNQLNKIYRAQQQNLQNFMEPQDEALAEANEPLYELIKQNTETTKDLCSSILELHNNKQLQLPLDDLMASYLHMHMNRLFISKNRLYEMLCYDFLHRYYMRVNAKKE